MSEMDTRGNVTAYDVNATTSRPTEVTDRCGNKTAYEYDAAGHLTSITAPDGSKMVYNYVVDLMNRINYPDGRDVEIFYSNTMPSSVIVFDTEGEEVHKVQYTVSNGCITGVTECGFEDDTAVQGTVTAFAYSPAARRTEVSVTNGEETVYTAYHFDEDGETVSEYTYTLDENGGVHPVVGDGAGVVNSINRLKNHTFEKGETVTAWQTMTNDESAKLNAYGGYADAPYGRRILRIDTQECAAAATANGAFQTVEGLAAGEYTFSAYVHVMKAYTGAGAYLRVTDSNGTVLAESEKLTKNEGWVRLSVPFVLSDTATVQMQLLADGTGMCHINAPQLEDGGCATVYNHLQNGNFLDSAGNPLSGTGALKLSAASVDAECCASQTVKPKMGAGTRETFTLSGWAKGVRLPDREREESEAPRFCLRAEVVYADENIPTETFTADFAPALEDWQFASVQFCKGHYASVSCVKVYCDYSFNEGTAHFDNLQLVRDILETALSAEDFVIESEEIEETAEDTTEEVVEEVAEETGELGFEEARDGHGNVLTETTFTDGEFGTLYRAFGFDETGNDRTAETDVRGNTTEYVVDGDTSRPTEVTDRCGNKTAYEYDEAGRTTKVTSKDANNTELAHVSYAYDAFDNMTEISRGDGMAYTLAYNPFHNLESIGIDGKTEKLVRYTYKNNNGRLQEIAYANGDKMTATYNGQGQLVAEKWYDVSNELTAHYKYVYDTAGNIVRSIDICGLKEYTYTYEEGRIVRATESDIVLSGEIVTGKTIRNTVRYVYDSEGTLTKKIVTPAGGTAMTTYYETTDDNTVVKFKAGSQTVTSHSKTDSFGRKVFDELQLGTGFVSRQFIYHAGDVTDEHTANGLLKSSATTQLVSQIVLSDGRTLSYEYDAEERITKVIDSVDGMTEYTYDALGQLLTETVNGVAVNTMTYDNYGNITSKNGVPYTYGDSNWHDLLTAYNGQTITYDAQGNPTNYMGNILSWEKGRQLKELVKPDGTLLEYTYNANGIRTSKTIRTEQGDVRHDYTLDGTKILRETWGNNTLVPLYDNEDSVCGIVHNGTPYYFLKNLQGDIIAITDSAGTVKARYTYDAWGACTVTKDDNGIGAVNPYRYRGYYYDVEAGLYYVSSRYYDPEIGRFLNTDDFSKLSANGVVFDYNTFSYCKNNSVCNKDEYGYFGTPVQWLFAAIGAVAGWFLGDYIAKKLGYYSGWKYWAIRVGVVVGGAVIGWFAAKLLTKILQSFLNANKAIYNKLPRLAKKFLGLKCFVAGTLVSTANGEVKIEEISVGDYVLTYNFDTGNTEYNKVLQVFKNTTDILTCVCFDDEEIVSTPSHRYYVAEKGWIKTKDLQPGDKLILYDNSTKAVKSVYTKRSSIAVPVYNLNVENQHNYFVSKYQVLVHNLGCEDVATNTLKKISKAQIKKLGGEKVTREIKKQFGKSLSNLYVDAKGNVYVSVNGSKIAQWVGDLATLAEMYR